MKQPAALNRAFWIAVTLLLSKVFFSILWEYQNYFPADFDAAFLSGKRNVFTGIYPAAFYTHIISGPITLLLATFLVFTGGRRRMRQWHRRTGKTLLALSLLIMLPSGLVMAKDAYAGAAAACGFAALSIATAICLIVAARYAAHRDIEKHKKWAMRSFILLISPLILRIGSGFLIWLNWESAFAYSMNAWLSWVLPLSVFEMIQWSAKTKFKPDAANTISTKSYRPT